MRTLLRWCVRLCAALGFLVLVLVILSALAYCQPGGLRDRERAAVEEISQW